MRNPLTWFAHALGTLLVILILCVAVIANWVYWQAASALPEHRLADGASSWRGCVTPGSKHQFVPLTAIPAHAVNAFLAAEDPDFFNREASNPLTDFTQALWNSRQRIGSQLTVSYARQLLTCQSNALADGMLFWHLRNALLHYRIERDVPKKNILETRINSSYFGRGSYGIAAAAKAYFHKPLAELALAEAALLGVLPREPSRYSNERFADKALAQRNEVLNRMARMGAITAQQAEAAKLEPLRVEKQVPAVEQAPKSAPVIAP